MAERRCDNCGIRMPAYRPRFTQDDGSRICEGCQNGRPGRPLTGAVQVKIPTVAQAPFIRISGHIVKTAHQSGDNVTIYHCGRGSEKYWTYDGLKTFEETVGTVQRVLTNAGRGNGGIWVDAMIHSFGVQRLWKVTLRRNNRVKETYWTAEHRWLVRSSQNNAAKIVETKHLLPGAKLAYQLPKSYLGRTFPSQFGIAHGITYGDGVLTSNGAVVRLWGEKDAQLLRYFSESLTYPEKTPNGVLGQRVVGLPNAFKSRPDDDESTAYLYGFLAGWFAADGCVGENGTAVISSASREDLEYFQLLAMRLGIASYDIRMQMCLGLGTELSAIYNLSLISSTIPSNFFLVAEHRIRHEDKIERGNPEPIGWTVESVEDSGIDEEVFCPRVPEYENFVLDGLINTKNCPFCGSGQVVAGSDGTISCDFCDTTFIVQVQPQQSSMPQTIDGVPQQLPGMPPPSADPGAKETAPPPEDEGKSFGGDDLSEKAHDPKDDPDPGSPPDGIAKDKQDSENTGDKAKAKDDDGVANLNKGAGKLYVTEAGIALPYDKYLEHLAITSSMDREATIEEVRAARLSFTHPRTGETVTRTTDADYSHISFVNGKAQWHMSRDAAERRAGRSGDVYALGAEHGTPKAETPARRGPKCPTCGKHQDEFDDPNQKPSAHMREHHTGAK
jgi:ribosomal protein L37AE/L43A